MARVSYGADGEPRRIILGIPGESPLYVVFDVNGALCEPRIAFYGDEQHPVLLDKIPMSDVEEAAAYAAAVLEHVQGQDETPDLVPVGVDQLHEASGH